MARRTRSRHALLGTLLVLVALAAVVIPFEVNRARSKRRVIELERARSVIEANLAALQAESMRLEQESRNLKSENEENQRRKLESELSRSIHVVDYAGWRNDTVSPSPDRRTPVLIDIPNPAARGEPLVPQENRKQH